MDIVGGVRAIIDVAALIYEQAKLVNCNRQQCKRLIERTKMITRSANKPTQGAANKTSLVKINEVLIIFFYKKQY